MIRFLGRRLLGGLVTLALFLLALFFLVDVLVPGDWTSGLIMTGDAKEELRRSLGIDRPFIEQFWTWISSVATLDLGTSFEGEPVWTAVRNAMATTLFVFVAATLISFPLGYWLGRASAWNQRRWLTIPNTAVAVMLFTAFPPAVAFLMERGLTNAVSAQAFRTFTQLDGDRWGPLGSRFQLPGIDASLEPSQVLWRMLAIALVIFTVFLLLQWPIRALFGRRVSPGVMAAMMTLGVTIGWRFSGFSGQAFDMASAMAFLIGGLVILSYGEVLLVTDAAMIDTRNEDFILTARAKGLPERAVRDRHSARAALLPVLSRLVISLPYFFTGLAILEFMFGANRGLGDLIFRAINAQDTPLIVGAMAIVGVITLVLRLVLEVSIAALDPRVRLISEQVQ